MSEEKNWIVCRCEEVTYAQLKLTVDKHRCSSREVKLRTRAGMGACGGRSCRASIERVVAASGGRDSDGPLPLKAQMPVRPMTFGEWGACE